MSVVNIRPTYDLKAAVGYVSGHDHERESAAYVSNGVDTSSWLEQAQTTMRLHNRRRVQGYTLIQSWSSDELDVNNPDDVQRANDAGQQLAKRLIGDSANYMVVTHTDGKGGKVHNHIIICNDVDGAAVRDARWTKAMKVNDDLMSDLGFERTERSADKQTTRQRRDALDGKSHSADDWVDDLKATIRQTAGTATNEEEWLGMMDDAGVSVKIRRSKKSVGISYKVDGHRPIRANRMGTDFQFESLNAQWEANRQKTVRMEESVKDTRLAQDVMDPELEDFMRRFKQEESEEPQREEPQHEDIGSLARLREQNERIQRDAVRKAMERDWTYKPKKREWIPKEEWLAKKREEERMQRVVQRRERDIERHDDMDLRGLEHQVEELRSSGMEEKPTHMNINTTHGVQQVETWVAESWYDGKLRKPLSAWIDKGGPKSAKTQIDKDAWKRLTAPDRAKDDMSIACKPMDVSQAILGAVMRGCASQRAGWTDAMVIVCVTAAMLALYNKAYKPWAMPMTNEAQLDYQRRMTDSARAEVERQGGVSEDAWERQGLSDVCEEMDSIWADGDKDREKAQEKAMQARVRRANRVASSVETLQSYDRVIGL